MQATTPAYDLPSYKVMKPRVLPRILLVDDDPLFGRIMQRAAACVSAKLDVVRAVEELSDERLQSYDVAVIDYDLGAFTGLELVRYVDDHSPLPVVLVSGKERSPGKRWSESIHEFLLKDRGPFAIIDAAFEAHEIARLNNQIRQGKSLS